MLPLDGRSLMRRVLLTVILALLGAPRVLPAQCDVRVLVAYYSQTGHTRIMAESVAAGARSVVGTQVTLASVEAVDTAQLRAAHAVIVGSPVQLANVAVPVMEFLNRWPFPDGMRDKVGAAFVSGGGISSGEEETQLAILRAMLIHSMIVVGGGEWSQAFGASAVSDEAPWASLPRGQVAGQFLEKAVRLGRRVATITRQLRCP
jgi:NAD(P)H dehydrogenase (quinone)